MSKRNYKVGAWYLELPKVEGRWGEGYVPFETKMDICLLEDYVGCTYDVSRKYDPLRAKDKITIKFYDNRGFIVWKEEYYESK